ncbi:MAG: hypothetical protein GIS02_00270 [Methanosarcinales archaeon]|uniref:Uncharacterized protein n=1 Tax=Candidatus Ethanoperedens thermophilum TaxID=2766897 RepID=A0A848D5M5_9EURY|nr:hypothetical protein [Candidatus Ethanoperedens thermophilum]
MPLFQTEQTTYIDINEASIRFNGSDATIMLYYKLTPAARAYIFSFGTSSLEPNIQGMFSNFKDTQVLNIRPEHAEILIRNVSKSNENYYLHHSIELPLTFRVLKVYTPNSRESRDYYYVNSTPDIFYPKE